MALVQRMQSYPTKIRDEPKNTPAAPTRQRDLLYAYAV